MQVLYIFHNGILYRPGKSTPFLIKPAPARPAEASCHPSRAPAAASPSSSATLRQLPAWHRYCYGPASTPLRHAPETFKNQLQHSPVFGQRTVSSSLKVFMKATMASSSASVSLRLPISSVFMFMAVSGRGQQLSRSPGSPGLQTGKVSRVL